MVARILAIVGVLWVTGEVAVAGPADPEIQKAQARAQAGDFLGAAASFRAAYALEPRPDLICNVGVAYQKANDLPRAQLFLSRCLDRGTALEADFVASVRNALAVVETTLRAGDFTPVDVLVDPPGAKVSIGSFAPDEAFFGSRLVWLAFGTYQITFSSPGFVERTVDVETRSRERTPVEVKLEAAPVAVPIVKPPPPEPLHKTFVSGPPRSKLPPIVATAATVLFAIGAVYSFEQAHSAADAAAFAATREAVANDQQTVDSWNTRMGISASLAVIGAGISAVVWYRALQTPAPVEVQATGDGASVSFRTRF